MTTREQHVKRIKEIVLDAMEGLVGKELLSAFLGTDMPDRHETVAKLIVAAVEHDLKRGIALDYGVLRLLGMGIPDLFIDDAVVPRDTCFRVKNHIAGSQVLVEIVDRAKRSN